VNFDILLIMAQTSLTAAIGERDIIKNVLQCVDAEIKGHVTKPLTEHGVNRLLSRVDAQENKLMEVHTRIQRFTPKKDLPGHEAELFTLLHEAWTLHSELSGILSRFPQTSRSTAPPPTAKADVRLPKLEIPDFTGNLLDWVSFRDMFQSTVHLSNSLTKVEKLAYLKSFVKDEPAQLLKSLTLCDANYDIAWLTLNERYQHDRELLFSILRKFDQQPRLQSESLSGIRTLIDTTRETIRSLHVLSFPLDKTSDAMFLYFILCKIDSTTKKLWDHSYTGNDVPKVDDLLKFMEKHARSLTSMSSEQLKSKPSFLSHGSSNNPKRTAQMNHTHEIPKCKVC
jgi:hypothetical protein